MLISLSSPCNCGNDNPREFIEYNGCIGYEAFICARCGRYFDHAGEYDADDFSKRILKNKGVNP